MFQFPDDRMIEPDELGEECEEIEKMYNEVAQKIEISDDANFHNKWLKQTLKAHIEMIENRTDWTVCQKSVRRKRVIAMWHNTEILKIEKIKAKEKIE